MENSGGTRYCEHFGAVEAAGSNGCRDPGLAYAGAELSGDTYHTLDDIYNGMDLPAPSLKQKGKISTLQLA